MACYGRRVTASIISCTASACLSIDDKPRRSLAPGQTRMFKKTRIIIHLAASSVNGWAEVGRSFHLDGVAEPISVAQSLDRPVTGCYTHNVGIRKSESRNPMAMQEAEIIDIVLRERRQITLPAEVCERLGLQVGDRLEASIEGDAILVRPKRSLAVRALQEIQAAFAASGISEEDLQQEGLRVRERIYKERYAGKAPRLP
jgi:AbrB family looped-hinge helix DNA binding protein